MKLLSNLQIKTILLSSEEQKRIRGGLHDVVSECSVTCDGEIKSKDCGRGIPCVTNGQTIQCGTEKPEDMCKKNES